MMIRPSCTTAAVLLLAAAAVVLPSFAFQPSIWTKLPTKRAAVVTVDARKGFDPNANKPSKPQKSAGQIKRDQERSKYDEISTTGGQEYNIFVRQFGSDDQSWLPCGAIAVPRQAQVSDAVFANETDLKRSISRTYPKLAGYEAEFEFGYNLKVYPDDPIEVASKTMKPAGISVGNWISNLLSPIDASKVPPPKMTED